MGRINFAKVVLGGLLAGLIINIGESILNILVLGPQMETALRDLGLQPVGGGSIGVFVVLAFVLGILAVWLYAAIRPRFGPGPKTAVRAGLLIWFLAYAWSGIGNAVIGVFPPGLVVIGIVWGLVEAVLATVAGAWIYKES